MCSGNTCRSPTAGGLFNTLGAEAGLVHASHVESFDIGNWHVGKRPDRAQQWRARDFERFATSWRWTGGVDEVVPICLES